MNGWRNDRWKRWLVALPLAFALVAVLANIAKWLIESNSSIIYTIHWLETVPFLTVAFAFVLQRAWAPQNSNGDGSESGS